MKSAMAKAEVAAVETMQPKNVSERMFANVFGVKGSSLSPSKEFEENPMARLKLLMVSEICLVRCPFYSRGGNCYRLLPSSLSTS